MSFMKGDLLTSPRKLVKGLARVEPVWLKAMEQSVFPLPFPFLGVPPPTFPRVNEIKRITLPEDVYIKKFFNKYPDSKHEDTIKFRGFEPPPARVFGQRVLQLKELGISKEDAITVAETEYRLEKKAKKKAYTRLKQIAKLQGKRPPPNPYPSAIKEIQAEERKFVRDRFFDPGVRRILERLKAEKAAEIRDRMGGAGF